MVFISFIALLVIISLLQIKFFRLSRQDVVTYFVPCAVTMLFIILNVLIPAWLFGWALQDFADRGLGIYADKPNPSNPMRPIFRLIFAAVLSGLIISTEIVAARSYLSRR